MLKKRLLVLAALVLSGSLLAGGAILHRGSDGCSVNSECHCGSCGSGQCQCSDCGSCCG